MNIFRKLFGMDKKAESFQLSNSSQPTESSTPTAAQGIATTVKLCEDHMYRLTAIEEDSLFLQAVDELQKAGPEGVRALAALIDELLAERCAEIKDALAVASRLSAEPELISAIRRVICAPPLTQVTAHSHFNPVIEGGGQIGWDDLEAARIREAGAEALCCLGLSDSGTATGSALPSIKLMWQCPECGAILQKKRVLMGMKGRANDLHDSEVCNRCSNSIPQSSIYNGQFDFACEDDCLKSMANDQGNFNFDNAITRWRYKGQVVSLQSDGAESGLAQDDQFSSSTDTGAHESAPAADQAMDVVIQGQLMWQKESDGVERTQAEAFAYCRALSLGGYKDWRLPTLDEFRSGGTDLVQGDHWTSSDEPRLSTNVAYINDGTTMFRTNKYYAIAVRNVQAADASRRSETERKQGIPTTADESVLRNEVQDLIAELVKIGNSSSFIASNASSEHSSEWGGSAKHVRARAIGERLNELGGFELMQNAYQEVKRKVGGDAPGDLEWCWHRVGEWEA